MADSILVDVAEAIAAELKTAFAAGSFDTFQVLDIDWEFIGRVKFSELDNTDILVRAFVPPKYDEIKPFDRAGNLEYTASWEIHVIKKLDSVQQDRSQYPSRDICRELTRLVEEIHAYWVDATDDDSDGRRVTAGSNAAMWIAQGSGVVHAYSPEWLSEQRMFYGVTREVFEVKV